jgi:hypothetical protein
MRLALACRTPCGTGETGAEAETMYSSGRGWSSWEKTRATGGMVEKKISSTTKV